MQTFQKSYFALVLNNIFKKMLLGEMTDVNITSAPVFRVTARNVILECRATDSGQRVRLYVTHPALMLYFIRFCDVATRHHVMGKYFIFFILGVFN